MRALMQNARQRGLKLMEGEVLTANTRMLALMEALGFRIERDKQDPGHSAGDQGPVTRPPSGLRGGRERLCPGPVPGPALTLGPRGLAVIGHLQPLMFPAGGPQWSG